MERVISKLWCEGKYICQFTNSSIVSPVSVCNNACMLNVLLEVQVFFIARVGNDQEEKVLAKLKKQKLLC